jgi:hypothetical protein
MEDDCWITKSGRFKLEHNENPAKANVGIPADFWLVLVFALLMLMLESNPFGNELNWQWD